MKLCFATRCGIKSTFIYYGITVVVTGAIQVLFGIAMIVYAVKYSDDVLVEAIEFDGLKLWGIICGAVVVTIGIMGIITGYFRAAFFKTLYTMLLFLLILI